MLDKIHSQKGFAPIVAVIIFAVMAIAGVAVFLAMSQSQDNRSRAAASCGGVGAACCNITGIGKGTCLAGTVCVPKGSSGAVCCPKSYAWDTASNSCKWRNPMVPTVTLRPTATPAPSCNISISISSCDRAKNICYSRVSGSTYAPISVYANGSLFANWRAPGGSGSLNFNCSKPLLLEGKLNGSNLCKKNIAAPCASLSCGNFMEFCCNGDYASRCATGLVCSNNQCYRAGTSPTPTYSPVTPAPTAPVSCAPNCGFNSSCNTSKDCKGCLSCITVAGSPTGKACIITQDGDLVYCKNQQGVGSVCTQAGTCTSVAPTIAPSPTPKYATPTPAGAY